METDNLKQQIEQERLEKGKVHAELSLLSSLPEGVKAEHWRGSLGYVIKLEVDELVFNYHLGEVFPHKAPVLTLQQDKGYPSLADGRDFLGELIGEWQPTTTVVDIANSLLKQSNKQGRFHLGSPMSLETWTSKACMGLFSAIEEDPQNPRFYKERGLVVTHTHILQLEVSPKYPDMGYLICFATIQTLSAIKRTKDDPDRIILQWKSVGDCPSFSQQFKMMEGEGFIELVSNNLEKLGGSIKKKSNKPPPVLKEDDVSAQGLQKVNIEEIVKEITALEQSLGAKLEKLKINRLMEMYSKAIEFYSAINDPQFDQYFNRMKNFFSNESVMKVMQEPDEPRVIREPEEPLIAQEPEEEEPQSQHPSIDNEPQPLEEILPQSEPEIPENCQETSQVLEESTGEVQEPEVQEPEVQEPEVQEPEVQEPEVQEPEVQEPELLSQESNPEDTKTLEATQEVPQQVEETKEETPEETQETVEETKETEESPETNEPEGTKEDS